MIIKLIKVAQLNHAKIFLSTNFQVLVFSFPSNLSNNESKLEENRGRWYD
jgi:hypothetical protein